MKITQLVQLLPVVAVANAATLPTDTWTNLTPTKTIASTVSALTDFDGSLALSVKTLAVSATPSSKAKRDVNQIGDGQVQHQTKAEASTTKAPASVVNQIGDGQIQHQTTAAAASVVNQIGDGQIQHQTKASVVNQIGDGQIQHQTKASVVNQIGDGQIQHQTAASVVNQIGDGQIQHQTTAAASVVNQIGDGQIQHQTTAAVASQIADGQVQQHTTAAVASQIHDGQVQQPSGKAAEKGTSDASTGSAFTETCVGENALTLELHDGVLRDKKGRIGAIVANRQFQFDGPPPQAGSIYAKGWSLVPGSYHGDSKDAEAKDAGESGYKLALGDSSIFYQCLSGDFYNLYDQSIGAQCAEVELYVLKAINC